MKRKFVYICSPYSWPSKYNPELKDKIEHARFETITDVAARLKGKYPLCTLFLPITQSHCMKKFNPKLGGSFKAWKGDDLFLVREKCDELWVIMMLGWDESIGVKAEIACAKRHKKPIRYFNPYTEKFERVK